VELSHLDPVDYHEIRSETVRAKFVLGADGAHSWVRKSFGIALDGESTEYIWGVLDIVPDTDFPDIRSQAAVHSANGSCMVVPREGDKVRLYLQLAENADLVGPDGRLDRNAATPQRLMEVSLVYTLLKSRLF
jgi:phenol 2-monooxygenase